ncbi:MAG: AraC family transcriptional regulator [Eubacterium sp.]
MENLFINDGEYSKRGYLKESFRVFNICDCLGLKFDYHYHEFDKIIFFISGKISYHIEGKEYCPLPGDIILVKHGDIHKPVIDPSLEYKRIVIWVNSNYLNRIENLGQCFDIDTKTVRLVSNLSKKLFNLAEELYIENGNSFAGELMREALLEQIMILLNRNVQNSNESPEFASNKQIDEIINYINENITENPSIDKIAQEFYLSRYYLMHKFKEYTGKSIYAYIQTKRLLYGASLLFEGKSAKEASLECGYNDYSVFLKAFKKEFGVAPSEYIKTRKQ